MVITQQAVIITVPSVGGEPILNLNVQQNDQLTPNRKRRLSHLTFEEKLHRKKLNNRVAAQLSRDKKKARMEDLEKANSLLTAQVEKLNASSASLRIQNEALSFENESLKQQLKDAQVTSAAALEALRNKKCTCSISSLNNNVDLFTDMGTEDLPDLCDLERLAESLLQDALEIAGEETGKVETMVGQASKNMEPSGPGCGTSLKLEKNELSSVEAVANPSVHSNSMTCHSKRNRRRNPTRTVSKPYDKLDSVQLSKPDTSVSLNSNSEGLSHSTSISMCPDDCITIVIPTLEDGESCVFLGEAIQEVTTSSLFLAPPCKDEPLSPHSDTAETAKSDCGYESLGSPLSEVSSSEMKDLWNESFSELFPVLV